MSGLKDYVWFGGTVWLGDCVGWGSCVGGVGPLPLSMEHSPHRPSVAAVASSGHWGTHGPLQAEICQQCTALPETWGLHVETEAGLTC